jgi:hypothetical protein
MKRTVIGRKQIKVKRLLEWGYSVSLELGKVYRTLPDRDAERHRMRRVIDESGEDYLFPAGWFIELQLPPAAKRALASLSS